MGRNKRTDNLIIIQARLYKKEDIEIYQQLLVSNKLNKTKNDIILEAFINGAKEMLLENNGKWVMELLEKSFMKQLRQEFKNQYEYVERLLTPLYINENILQELVIFILNQIGELSSNVSDYRNPTDYMLNPPPWVKQLVQKIEDKFIKNNITK